MAALLVWLGVMLAAAAAGVWFLFDRFPEVFTAGRRRSAPVAVVLVLAGLVVLGLVSFVVIATLRRPQ